MATIKGLIIVLSVALALNLVHADHGLATFYTVYKPSACFGFTEEGVQIAAASDALWDDGAACGRHYQVTCTGAVFKNDPHPCTGDSVTVKIVDRCPSPGCNGDLDLSQEAFAQISNIDANKIKIAYNEV